MIREITFRGISVETGEWVYGYYGKLETMSGEKHFIITPTVTFTESVSAYFTDYEVKPKTVGQYTGLKDKNGVQIYEGDILKQEYTREYNDAYHPVTLGYVGGETDFGWHKGVVAITASNGACLRNPIHHSDSYGVTEVTRMYKRIAGYRSEVIGNIYENPELFEGER